MADLEKKVTIPIEADTSNFDSKIDKSKKDAAKEVVVPVEVDTAGIIKSLNSILEKVGQISSAFGKGFKFSGLQSELDSVSGKLNNLVKETKKGTSYINVKPMGLNGMIDDISDITNNIKALNDTKIDISSFEKLSDTLSKIESLVNSIVEGMNFDNIRPSAQVQADIDKTTAKLEELSSTKKKIESLQKTLQDGTGKRTASRFYNDGDFEDVDTKTLDNLVSKAKEYVKLGGDLSKITYRVHDVSSGGAMETHSLQELLKEIGKLEDETGNKKYSIDVDTSDIKNSVNDITNLEESLGNLEDEFQKAKMRENRDLNVSLDTKSVENFTEAMKEMVQSIGSLDIKLPKDFTFDGLSTENLEKIIGKLDEIVSTINEINTLLSTGVGTSNFQDILNTKVDISTDGAESELVSLMDLLKQIREAIESINSIELKPETEEVVPGKDDKKNSSKSKSSKAKFSGKKDSSALDEKLQKEAEAVNKTVDNVTDGTNSVITSVSKFNDSQGELVKAQVKTKETLDDAVKNTTTTLEYNDKGDLSVSGSVEHYDYEAARKQNAKESEKSYNAEISLLKEINKLKIANISTDETTKAGNEKRIELLESEINKEQEKRTLNKLATSDGDNRILEEEVRLKTELSQAQEALNAKVKKQAELNQSANKEISKQYNRQNYDLIKEQLTGTKLGNATFSDIKTDSSGKATLTFIENVGDVAKVATVKVDSLNDAVDRIKGEDFDATGLKPAFSDKSIKTKDVTVSANNTSSLKDEEEKALSLNEAYRRLNDSKEEYLSLNSKVANNTATDKEITQLDELIAKRKEAADVIRDSTSNKIGNLAGYKSGDDYKKSFDKAIQKVKEWDAELESGGITAEEYKNKISQLQKDLKGSDSKNVIDFVDTDDIAKAQSAMNEYAKVISKGAALQKSASQSGDNITYTWKDQENAVHTLTLSYNQLTGAISEVGKVSSLDSVNNAINKTAESMKKLQWYGTGEKFEDVFAQASQRVEGLNEKLKSGDISLDKYKSSIEKIQKAVKNKDTVKFIDTDDLNEAQDVMKNLAKMENDTAKITTDNGKVTAMWTDQNNMIQKVTYSYDELSKAITRTDNVQKGELTKGERITQMFKKGWSNVAQYVASFAGFYEIIEQVQKGVTVVTELDTALTEMRKVSDESLSSLKSFQKESFDIAGDVGTTAQQIQNSTADWMRKSSRYMETYN